MDGRQLAATADYPRDEFFGHEHPPEGGGVAAAKSSWDRTEVDR